MVKRQRKVGRTPGRAVTWERCRRLARLVELLRAGPQDRATLLRSLRVELRGFYRDLELLREAGVGVIVRVHRYELALPARQAVRLIPFPDPGLTLGEVELLAKGKSKAHAKLRKQFKGLMPATLG